MLARTVSPLKPFTLIGATTRAGIERARSRFGIGHHLKHYSSDDLLLI